LTLCIPKIRPLTLCIQKTRPLTLCIPKIHQFETLQLEGEIAENVIKNIENAKKYLSELWYEDLQTIINCVFQKSTP
jgi:hypothetical protein